MDYVPTVFDNFSANVVVDGNTMNLGLWDKVDRMVKEAERFSKENKEKRDAIDTKNQADSLIYQIEKQLKERWATRSLCPSGRRWMPNWESLRIPSPVGQPKCYGRSLFPSCDRHYGKFKSLCITKRHTAVNTHRNISCDPCFLWFISNFYIIIRCSGNRRGASNKQVADGSEPHLAIRFTAIICISCAVIGNLDPKWSTMKKMMVGVWTMCLWEQMGQPEKVNLVELGPGRGTLMSDIFLGTSKFQQFAKSLQIHMVDCSLILQRLQCSPLKCAKE